VIRHFRPSRFTSVAEHVLLEPCAHAGDRFEYMHLSRRSDVFRQMRRDCADVGTGVETGHTGPDHSVDIPVKSHVVIAEGNDREIEMVTRVQQQFGSPAIPPPGVAKGTPEVQSRPEQGSEKIHQARVVDSLMTATPPFHATLPRCDVSRCFSVGQEGA